MRCITALSLAFLAASGAARAGGGDEPKKPVLNLGGIDEPGGSVAGGGTDPTGSAFSM